MIPIQPSMVKKASEVDQEVPKKMSEMEEKVEVLQKEPKTENPRLQNFIEVTFRIVKWLLSLTDIVEGSEKVSSPQAVPRTMLLQ